MDNSYEVARRTFISSVEMLKFKMDPALKAEWVAALRSGKYPQGHGFLITGDEDAPAYCCLGVLGCLMEEKHPGSVVNLTRYNAAYLAVMNPTPPVKFPPVPEQIQGELGSLNDNEGTFDQIADLIEKYL